MAENESFFRKVVRFVAHPATEWTELNSRQGDHREAELERSELKAMIERKRRNDFVRKREFDMLRRVRREGLSADQLAALGGSSRLDDSEPRFADGASGPTRQDAGVKAKIDEIEQQMVGEGSGFAASSRRARLDAARAGSLARPAMPPPPTLPPSSRHFADTDEQLPALPPLDMDLSGPPTLAPVTMSPGLPPLSPGGTDVAFDRSPAPRAEVEVSEVVHDPELDEAVIAFANADFAHCEHCIQQLIAPSGSRAHHAETWLALFDLYRAIGQQPRFESLANDYANRFGLSAPQWFSLPKIVSDAVAEERPDMRQPGTVGWISPPVLDLEAVAKLRSQTLQMPLPWVFDWTALQGIEAEAATQLSALFRLWAGQNLEMQWVSGERLFATLQESAPTGVRDADPAFWLTRLDALRLANRADQFDETAIDYCVTYEVSPPSWEPARCRVRISSSELSTRTPAMSTISEVSTSFMESVLEEDADGRVQMATVDLSGQLVGDIGATLRKLDGELGLAPLVNVSCARLIRVDFLAAGDLLNWVLAKRNEQRSVTFADAHRLVALFFGAMGINEHARVQVRRN